MIQLVNLLLGIVSSIIGAVFELLIDFSSAIIPLRRRIQYNADFLPSREILFRNEKGFCLTGKRSLSIEDSFSNGLVLGGSGSGKSSRVLIPSILKMAGHSSLVIHDPSGELFEKTSGALADAGYEIKILNYGKPEISEGFNPLDRAISSSDIQKVSKMVMHTSLGQGKDPFWNTSGEGLIALFARYLVNHSEKKFQTLHNVLHLINTFGASPEKVDLLIVHTNDPTLIADYKAFVAYDSKMLMSIVATARAALSVFADTSVAKVTAHDTISFDEFRRKKVALFINNSVKDMRYYSVISSIFFEQFWGLIMSQIPGKKELPIFFLLDEASSLFLNSLPITVSNIRKFKSGMLQVYQHYHQMVQLYGNAEARNIAANCYAKVYMSGQPIEVATELETTLGKFEFVDNDDIRRTRSLLTADEIRQLKESIILCGNLPPIKAKMIPYYEQRKLKKLSLIPQYQVQNKLSFNTPPLIQFDGNESA